MKNIAVIGAGGWGTALAIHLAGRGANVTLWAYEADEVAKMNATRLNKTFLPGVELPANIRVTNDMRDALGAELALLVPPSKAMRAVAKSFAALNPPRSMVLLSCTKGIELHSGLRMSEIITEFLPENPIAVLSGPSHAEEVARKAPTAVVIGCADHDIAERLQAAFSGGTFRAYTSTDVAGIELGGALKNIFALGAGVADGLGLGDNTKAALVTRSLAELIRLGVALGGRRETFQGLSGIGDLMVTCFSKHSRNRGVGERLGRGETLEQISAGMAMVAEGVPTTLSAAECARKLGVETPIIGQISAILYENKPAREAMMELMSRDPRPEADTD
jgi:glycerol-3-phosphate dehydrogenase (NAD(P)+)